MLNKKRGFTLLELTIVMAVTAIMAAGIVTFCVTVKGISDSTKAETGVFNDVASIRAYAATDDGTTDESTLVFTLGAYGCKVTATLTRGETPVTDGEDNLDGVTLTVTAISLTNAGKTVHTTSYTKGGGNA